MERIREAGGQRESSNSFMVRITTDLNPDLGELSENLYHSLVTHTQQEIHCSVLAQPPLKLAQWFQDIGFNFVPSTIRENMFSPARRKGTSRPEPEESFLIRAQHCLWVGRELKETDFSEFYFKSHLFRSSWDVSPQVYGSVYTGPSRQETVFSLRRHEPADHTK